MNFQRKNNLEAKYLGVPLVFEGSYNFDSKSLIPIFETYTQESKFDNFGLNIVGLEVGNAGSSAYSNLEQNFPHNLPQLADFSDYVLQCAKEIFLEWGVVSDSPRIGRSWVNRHGQGGWTNWHVHENVDLVASAYVQYKPGCGDLFMIDPLEFHWFNYGTSRSNSGTPHASRVPISANKVIFFAPFIRHAVEPNKTEHDRWVLSCNIMRG